MRSVPPVIHRFLFLALAVCCAPACSSAADQPAAKPAPAGQPAAKQVPMDQPVIVDGNTVEYVAERSEITAIGNVRVDYKGTLLTCDSLTVNTVTKDAVAEGKVRIEDKNGIMKGDRIVYNLNTKKGAVLRALTSSPPFFFRSDVITMKNEKEFIAQKGYATTCGMDHPHYRIRSSKARMEVGERLQMYNNVLLFGGTPVFYLPYYNQSLKEPFMHIQLTPGYSKKWGGFLLSAYRFQVNDAMSARLYLDYRSRLGVAEGAGVNYDTRSLGKGDAKIYYTEERPYNQKSGGPGDFERGLVRWRHQWEIDPKTNFIADIYQIKDEKRARKGADYDFLKDYFPQEYDENSQPPTYAQLHRTFGMSSLDVFGQYRSSKWYSQIDRLPEVRYTLPDVQVTGDEADYPVYFADTTQAVYLRQRAASPAAPGTEYSVGRLDSYNKFSWPLRAGFVALTPFAAMRNTSYTRDINDNSIGPRTVLYAGSSASTKFYRIYETPPHFMGMDIDDIRHIITPTLEYGYNTDPNIRSSRLRQFDSTDAIGQDSFVSMVLSNRLQTKRENASVELLDFRVSSGYVLYRVDPLTNAVKRDQLQDTIDFDLGFYPYSWLSITGDSQYNYEKQYVNTASYDVSFNVGKNKRVGFGQRYERRESNEFTTGLDWQLTPKWNFHVYERYQLKAREHRGFWKQEYAFIRDLHCWQMELTYTVDRDEGNSFWLVFRLKAFPEAEASLTKSYNAPKLGSHQQ